MATVTIPETQYVGVNIHRSHDGSMPLGFLTPGGDNAAAKKRISTVDSWMGRAGGRHEYTPTADKVQFEKDNPTAKWIRDNTHVPGELNSLYEIPRVEGIDFKIYDNVPNEARLGFRITRSISRGGSWNGGNKVVRIEDPRGFELEISVDNMVKMMSMTTFVEGVCQEKCVWGRQGASNILLPVTSDEYQEAVNVTKYRAQENISLRDVNFGDTVVLKKTENFEGLTGVYMGPYHVQSLQKLDTSDAFNKHNRYRYGKCDFSFVKTHKRYIIDVKGKYYGVSGCKIHEVLKKVDTPLERTDLPVDNFTDFSNGQVGTPIRLTVKKVPIGDIVKTLEFVEAEDTSLLTTLDTGALSIWAIIPNMMPMRFRRDYSSIHYRDSSTESEAERLKIFTGEVTDFDVDANTWAITEHKGEGGKGPFAILKDVMCKPGLSVEDYEWFQLAFTINGVQCKVPVKEMRGY